MAEANEHLTGLEIAVTGIGLRFPGASTIHEFWDNLEKGIESISFFSKEEMRAAGVPEETLQDPNYVAAKGIVDHIEWFDPGVFDYTPAEATVLDPQLRLFHECCFEALEDAGVNSAVFKGKIGLFAGAANNFFWQALAYTAASGHVLDAFSTYQLVNKDAVAALVSYKLNLRGPGYSLNTACSTSLVTVHLAVQALLGGECRLALAGGTTVMLPQKQGYLYREGMVSSPDGHCRAFDIDARGTVGGDGAGVVLLKMYEEALEDRDHVYALLKGSATNNDGSRKSGYTAPSIQGQAGVIRAAQAFAEVAADTIGLIEAHGTATPIGDPIELEALKKVFASQRKNACAVGSVKTNVGHLDAAAGIAGLIKAILSLYHKKIPPSLHFNEPNPKLEIQDSPFYINDSLRPFPRNNHPRRAGVSSFGVGGTNAHVVLEEAPVLPANTNSPSRPYQLLLLSANSEDSLQRKVEELTLHLQGDAAIDLADAAYTLQTGRKEFPLRRMAVCRSIDDAIDPTSYSRTNRAPRHQPPVIFLFTGIGSQYRTMGRDLYLRESSFRQDMDQCFAIYNRLAGIDLKETLYPEAEEHRHLEAELIDAFHLAQPILFAVEYSLARLLMGWGVKPHSMIGYSFGEYVAACLSGVVSVEDALRMIFVRGEAAAKIAGGMLSVPLAADAMLPYLENELYLAIDNGDSCVIAGKIDRLDALEARLKRDKLFCVRVQNPCPLHSPLMKPAADELRQAIEAMNLNPPEIPYISNVTGTWMTVEDAMDPSYFARHAAETARFAEGMNQIFDDPAAILVEIGPGRDLSSMLGRFMESKGSSPRQIVNVLRPAHQNQPDLEYLLQKTGHLWLRGVSIDWDGYYGEKKRRRIPLPTYPFDRKRYWIDGNPFQAASSGSATVSVFMEEDNQEARVAEDHPLEFNGHCVEAENHIQRQLVEMWRRFFGIDAIGIRDDFFELGGDSLKAMNVAALIEKEMGVEVPVGEFYNRHTVENLSMFIEAVRSGRRASRPQPIEKKDYYPLSSAQRRLFALQRMAEDTTGYNEPIAVSITGELDLQKVERAFAGLIERHEVLRTRFVLLDGEPVQQVLEAGSIDFAIQHPRLNSSNHEPEELIKEFIRPFDLAQAPILRVKVIEEDCNRHILMVDTHHIISDGTTQTILMKEFAALYSGSTLASLPVQYKDFAHWQDRLLADGELRTQEEYWLEVFADQPPALELPYDRPRPALLSFKGTTVQFSIDDSDTRRLKKLAATNESSLFMVVLAVFNVLLSRLSGNEDIVVGSPIAGRRFVELQPLMGMFVNTLALRNRPPAPASFLTFLNEVRRNAIAAFDHQDYQFETLVQRVAVKRDTGRNPLFDVMFALQNIQLPEMELPGLTIEPLLPDTGATKFDLSLLGFEREEGIDFSLEYNTDLFDPATIQRFIDYFKSIISQATARPELPISDIDIMSPGEKLQLLESLSGDAVELKNESTFMDDWRRQAAHNGDRIALIQSNHQLSYRCCDAQARQLAHELRQQGAGPGRIVAIMAEPSLEVMIGILAILCCGGAFLPIDRDYPSERIEYMLRDSESVLILASEADEKLIPNGTPVYFFPQDSLDLGDDDECADRCKPEDPAYCIYTSGSTGKPKGVMISHRNLANFYRWHNTRFGLTHHDRGAKYAGFSFDASILEIFPFLAAGASIYLFQKEDRLDLEAIDRIFFRHAVTVAYLPTALSRPFMELKNHSLRLLHVGGEKLGAYIPGDYLVADNYGPSECTVVATCNVLDRERTRLSIGTPVHNTTVCILDRYDRLQPPGVPGELCIAGECVGMGYLNRPELTGRSFVPHPLLPGQRMYKTGDIVRYTADGFLEFLGRKDQQVKIRGFRIELGEIETLLLQHPSLATGVVAALDHDDGSKYLCAYVVPSATIDANQLKRHLGAKLPDYMIPSYFVELDALPLNQNGKIDRPRLPQPERELLDGDDFQAPSNQVEETLLHAARHVLGLPVISMGDNFFDLGGDSIKAIQLSAILRKHRLKLEVKDLFLDPVFSAAAAHVKPVDRVISQGPVSGEAVSTPAQRALFQQTGFLPNLFNQGIMLFRRQGFDGASVREAFARLMDHHDALRMVFPSEGDAPAPYNRPPGPETFAFDVFDFSGDSSPRRSIMDKANEIQGSLEVVSGPLVRSALFKTAEGDHLLVVIHHLAIDTISWHILLEDLSIALRQISSGRTVSLPPKTDSFLDWTHSLANYAERGELLDEIGYWRDIHSLDCRLLDDARKAKGELKKKIHAASVSDHPLSPHETEELLSGANRAYNTELGDILLAALALALHRWSGRRQHAVSIEGHGRGDLGEQIDVCRTVGRFASRYPIILTAPEDLDVGSAVKQTKEMLRSVPNNGIGYGMLRYLTPAPEMIDLSFHREPDICFNFSGLFEKPAGGGDQVFEFSPLSVGAMVDPRLPMRFSLDIDSVIVDRKLSVTFTYNRNEYSPEEIRSLFDHYGAALREILHHCMGRENAECTASDFTISDMDEDELDLVYDALDEVLNI